MLRKIFEATGDFFVWTFSFMPALGDTINTLFMLTIAGGLLYWIGQMRKHKANGES